MRFPANPCRRPRRHFNRHELGPNRGTSRLAVPDGPRPQPLVELDYTRPASHFPNPIGPYRSHSVAAPDLSNTPRIEQLMQNGKLMLSMNDAVALAMENNLDIAIQRYNLNIADTDILRAQAGGSTLGVNSGIVSGTPGGGTGGLSGVGRLRHRRHQRGFRRRRHRCGWPG